MEETPAYFPAVSLHLSRTLDEVGLNMLTVKTRQNTYLYTEQLSSIICSLTEQQRVSYFHFGSQTEGTTTEGLDSDIDTLMCYDAFNVIESWAQWQPNTANVLMLQEDTAPGYCRLQALRPDVPMAEEDLINDDFTYDSRGRVLLPNTICFQPPETNVSEIRNGPATSRNGGFFGFDKDHVQSFRCSAWPEQAGEFIRRRRRHGWPSPRLVQKCIKHGVFLVPVGHKLSSTEHLEWRISPSMAERCLMFSLGLVHIKCYVVLKILIKTFIKPVVGKYISSYHCKTALLYCTENTESIFWRDDNLLQCVQRCLVMLLTWVDDGFCPQFIISEENLFAGKVTAQNRDVLKAILTCLINSKGRALLCVEIDDINRLLQYKLNTEPSMVEVLDSEQTVWLIGRLECYRHDIIDVYTLDILVNNVNSAPLPVIRFACEQIKTLESRARGSDKHERQAIQTTIVFLSGWLGSMMASFSLSYNRPLPRKAIQLMHRAAKYDVAAALKLASVLYSNGDLRKVDMMLQRVDDFVCTNETYSQCTCYRKRNNYTFPFCGMMYTMKGTKARSGLFAHCVTFSAQEIHCAPPALRNELHKAAGDDVIHRDPDNDNWMCLGVVDCLPFLYYLQYLTYTQLGKQEQRQRSLDILEMWVEEYDNSGHLETAWNLLGQCMEMEDDHDAALQCYMTSLEVRPRNNAANWHVAILCYTQLQKRGLLK